MTRAERNKKWREENPDYHKKWNEKRPDYSMDKSLKRRYGITKIQYDTLLMQQDYCCAVCGLHEEAHRTNLVVDHNHSKQIGEEGFVRGILCSNCNTALGLLKDSPAIVDKAAEYLREKGHGSYV